MNSQTFMSRLNGHTDFDGINLQWTNMLDIPTRAFDESREIIQNILYYKPVSNAFVIFVKEDQFYTNCDKYMSDSFKKNSISLHEILTSVGLRKNDYINNAMTEMLQNASQTSSDLTTLYNQIREFVEIWHESHGGEINIHVIMQSSIKKYGDLARILCRMLSDNNTTKLLVSISDV